MSFQQRPRALVFDVIGTLFSLESQRARLTACGLPGHALETWFAASLRDLFALGITGHTAPMVAVLQDNLHSLLSANHLRQDGPRVEAVLDGMRELPPQPDAIQALDRIHQQDVRCAALTNGGLRATESLLERAKLRHCFEQVMSIDEIGLPKPRPETYAAMASRLHLAPDQVMMVASHPWDLQGARHSGFATAYVSRGLRWPSSLEAPDIQSPDLIGVAEWLSRG